MGSVEKFIGECVGLLLVFAFIAWKVAPPLRRLMHQQEETIRSSISSADETRAGAEAELASARARLEAARGEAATIVEQARVTAAQLEAEGVARGEADYARLVQNAEVEAEFERQRAREEVTREVGAVVMAATERVVAAELDAGRQRALISETIGAAEAISATEALA